MYFEKALGRTVGDTNHLVISVVSPTESLPEFNTN